MTLRNSYFASRLHRVLKSPFSRRKSQNRHELSNSYHDIRDPSNPLTCCPVLHNAGQPVDIHYASSVLLDECHSSLIVDDFHDNSFSHCDLNCSRGSSDSIVIPRMTQHCQNRDRTHITAAFTEAFLRGEELSASSGTPEFGSEGEKDIQNGSIYVDDPLDAKYLFFKSRSGSDERLNFSSHGHFRSACESVKQLAVDNDNKPHGEQHSSFRVAAGGQVILRRNRFYC